MLKNAVSFIFADSAGLLKSSRATDLVILNEGELFNIDCFTTQFGYPPPVISMNLRSVIISISQGVKDEYGGEKVKASAKVTAQKSWHGKQLRCKLQQQHFPTQETNITLYISRNENNFIREIQELKQFITLL